MKTKRMLALCALLVLVQACLSVPALAYTTGSIAVGTTELVDPPYVFVQNVGPKQTDTDNEVNHWYSISSGDDTVRNHRIRLWTMQDLSSTAALWSPANGREYVLGIGGTRNVVGVYLKLKGRANTDCTTTTVKFTGDLIIDP